MGGSRSSVFGTRRGVSLKAKCRRSRLFLTCWTGSDWSGAQRRKRRFGKPHRARNEIFYCTTHVRLGLANHEGFYPNFVVGCCCGTGMGTHISYSLSVFRVIRHEIGNTAWHHIADRCGWEAAGGLGSHVVTQLLLAQKGHISASYHIFQDSRSETVV